MAGRRIGATASVSTQKQGRSPCALAESSRPHWQLSRSTAAEAPAQQLHADGSPPPPATAGRRRAPSADSCAAPLRSACLYFIVFLVSNGVVISCNLRNGEKHNFFLLLFLRTTAALARPNNKVGTRHHSERGEKMATKFGPLKAAVKEIRIHLCQTSKASEGARCEHARPRLVVFVSLTCLLIFIECFARTLLSLHTPWCSYLHVYAAESSKISGLAGIL